MNIKKTSYLFCIISLACIVMLSSCTDDNEEKAAEQNYTVAVKTAAVTAQTLQPYIELNGNIEAKNSVSVYPNIAGKIAGTRVNLGSYVKKGEVILYVDPSTPGVSYSLSQITAPISGSIVSIPPQYGVKVTTDTPVITIGDLSQLEVKTYIPEKYFGTLQVGLTAEVRVEAYSNVTFGATVKSISPVVDPNSRTVETILQFDQKDNRITAGMFSKVKLYFASYKDVIAVAENAVTVRKDQLIVFTIEDGKAKSMPIEKGITVDGMVQIVSGLNIGDVIITEGINSVLDGTAVTVINEQHSDS